MKNVKMGEYKVKTFTGNEPIDVELAMKKWIKTHKYEEAYGDYITKQNGNIVGVLIWQ